MLAQKLHRFLVLDLPEVLVELADGPEQLRGEQTDHFVAPAADLRQPVRGGDRHRHDQLARLLSLDGLQGRDHRRTRGDAVVGHDHRAARDPRLRPGGAEELPAPCDLGQLVVSLLRQVVFQHVEEPLGVVIEVNLSVLGNRPDRQLRLPGRPQLARQDHVEFRAQLLGKRGPDDHAAAGDRQHQRLVKRPSLQLRRQLVGGVLSVMKHGHFPPPYGSRVVLIVYRRPNRSERRPGRWVTCWEGLLRRLLYPIHKDLISYTLCAQCLTCLPSCCSTLAIMSARWCGWCLRSSITTVMMLRSGFQTTTSGQLRMAASTWSQSSVTASRHHLRECSGGTPAAVRYRRNHSFASRATSSNVPGSSKRWVAPGTTTSSLGQRSRRRARRFNSSTTSS